MHRTVTLSSPRAHTCQQSNAYFKGVSLESIPCGFGSLVPGCCASTLLELECKNCVVQQKFLLKDFRERLKIHEIHKMKYPQKNLALYDIALQ